MRLLADRVSRRTAWRIAREHGWDTLRDAEYLAMTKLQADALVTVDTALAGWRHRQRLSCRTCRSEANLIGLSREQSGSWWSLERTFQWSPRVCATRSSYR